MWYVKSQVFTPFIAWKGCFNTLKGYQLTITMNYNGSKKCKSRNDDCIIHVLIIWCTMAPNAPSIVASNKFSTKGGGAGLQLIYRLAFQLLHM